MVIYLADLAHTKSVDNKSLTVPLNIGYIKAYAMEVHKGSVDISLFKHPERLLARVEKQKPDIIGFANYGWNVNLNWAIGNYLKKELPDTLFVAGGPNIDPDPERQMAFFKRHNYLDFLVIDGGEEPFSELISWHREAGKNYKALPSNLIWLENGSIQKTTERPLTKQIENIPSPYLSGYLDEFIEYDMVPLFETNRGCPFQCTFCAWGSASKNLVRRFDQDVAIAEIEYVGARSKAHNWIVCDANFGLLKRDIEIAKAIRNVKDQYGTPHTCDIWLAKNVTERNLEIGEILSDMAVPVMAVQSLNDQVLKNIKRGNISKETYAEYQQKFHAIGSRTYSDVIVPLPGETLDTHIHALYQLFNFEVDNIHNHNMRLLPGAETNSTETRQEYGFRTRYRLIHGDAGIYQTPSGNQIRCFEYEESLRSTKTMTEEEVFYLRKLHFLVDFCWNTEIYKPLLKVMKFYGVNPIEVLQRFLTFGESADSTTVPQSGHLSAFWRHFDQMSHEEWFDSEKDIRSYFAKDENFNRLINQEFEKLNILFSVIALRDYKQEFDEGMRQVTHEFSQVPKDVLDLALKLVAATFPALDTPSTPESIEISSGLVALGLQSTAVFQPSQDQQRIYFSENPQRTQIKDIILRAEGRTLSKILNTQGISLRNLKFNIKKECASAVVL